MANTYQENNFIIDLFSRDYQSLDSTSTFKHIR